jgi:hypothetical protein
VSGVEIDLSALGDEFAPGVRAEVGLDELREALADAHGPVHLHLHASDPGNVGGGDIFGSVESVGAGVVRLQSFGDAENEDTLVPLNRIVWMKVRRRA